MDMTRRYKKSLTSTHPQSRWAEMDLRRNNALVNKDHFTHPHTQRNTHSIPWQQKTTPTSLPPQFSSLPYPLSIRHINCISLNPHPTPNTALLFHSWCQATNKPSHNSYSWPSASKLGTSSQSPNRPTLIDLHLTPTHNVTILSVAITSSVHHCTLKKTFVDVYLVFNGWIREANRIHVNIYLRLDIALSNLAHWRSNLPISVWKLTDVLRLQSRNSK